MPGSPHASMKESDRRESLYEGVSLIAYGINGGSIEDLKDAFGKVHSVLLNKIVFAALKAVGDREHDGRFYPVVHDAARLVKEL